MVFTDYGRQALTWSLGSNITNNYIAYINVGSGSGTALVTDTELYNEFTRFPITGSPNFDTAKQVTFTGDLNSVQASGLILQEWGLLANGSSLLGSLWQRESLGSLVFDGTNELRIESTIQII